MQRLLLALAQLRDARALHGDAGSLERSGQYLHSWLAQSRNIEVKARILSSGFACVCPDAVEIVFSLLDAHTAIAWGWCDSET